MSMFDHFEDEDCWLTPSRNASTQSEKFSIEAYLSDLKLSENASRLSKKIAKAQQKRALRAKKLEPLTEDIREKSRSPIRARQEMGASSSSPTCPLTHSALEPFFGQVEAKRLTSTPSSSSQPAVSFQLPTSPISAGLGEEEEDFEDAQDEFSEEAMERISMTSSFSMIEALLSKSDGDEELGQSLIRAPMSQSLVKVEEEEIPRTEIMLDNSPRNYRSTSVSPRPLSNSFDLTSTAPSQTNSERSDQSRAFARNGMERRSLGSATLLRTARSQSRTPGKVGFTLLATPNGRQSRPTRSAKVTPPKSSSSQQVTPLRPPENPAKIVYNLHADLADLDELTRRQEELLRQEVMQQQQGERKTSWQGDSGSMSSSSSLASSKSVDIASLKSNLTPAPPPSRLRPPSKLPRPTGHFSTPSRISTLSHRSSALEKSGSSADDDCF